MSELAKIECPQCEQLISLATTMAYPNSIVRDKLGHDWHKVCWDEAEAQYNQILESDLKAAKRYYCPQCGHSGWDGEACGVCSFYI